MSKGVFDYTFDLLADMIESRRGDSEPRQIYWEIMSSRNWANPQFSSLVEEVIAFSQLIEPEFRNNTPFEDILQEAAEEYLHLDIGDLIVNDRNLANRVTERQWDEASAASKEKARAVAAIERMMASGSRRGPDRGRDAGRGRDTGRGRPDPRDYARDRRSNNPRERFSNRGYDTPRNRPGEGSMMSGGLGAARRREAEMREREEVRSSRDREERQRDHVREERRPEPRPIEPAPVKQPSGISRQEASKYTVNGPDFSKPRPYDDFMLNGEIYQAAHLSHFKLDAKEHPFLTAYDFNKKIRFLVKDQDGHIREEFIDMNQDMDYLRHELAGTDPREARRQATENKRPKVKLSESEDVPVRQERPVKRIRLDLNLSKMDKVSIMSSSIAEAEATVGMERLIKDEDVCARHVILTSPMLSDEATIEALEDLANARSLPEAAELLRDYRESIDPVIYKALNEKMASRLTHAMRNEYGMKVKMTDFAESYSKAYEWMRENRGEKWARAFSDKNRILIDEVFLCLSQKDKVGLDYLSGLFDMEESDIAQKLKVSVIQDHYTIISTKAKMKDLSITVSEDPQLVCSREMPDLHRLIEESFAAGMETSGGMGRIYLLTQDGVRIEFFRNGLDNDSYLIARMP